MNEPRTTFNLNKLVRDNLPDKMREVGQEVELVTLSGEAHTKALIAKIAEELAELDPHADSYHNELADLKQAILDLIDLSGHGDAVEEFRLKDLVNRGGFLAGQFVSRLSLDAHDPWVEYYRQNPQKYPEIC